MNRKFIISLLCFFPFFAQAAIDETSPHFTMQNSIIEAVPIPANTQSSIHPYWIHQLQSANSDNSIQLTNGVKMHIGWWWQSTAKKWQAGDQITLQYDAGATYNFVLMTNLTKNQTAWGNLLDISTDSTQLKFVASFEDHNTVLVLEDGTRLKAASAFTFMDWEEGDPVIPLSVRGSKKPYGLWNPFLLEITENFQIIE